MYSVAESFFEEIDPDQNYYDEVFSNSNFCNESSYYSQGEFLNIMKTQKSFSTIINHNIRSFNANSDSFLCGFEDRNMPEVFVFTETWFTANNVSAINGYTDHHTIREQGRSGSVSVYAKSSISSHKIEELSFANSKIEVCTVEVRLHDEVWYIIGIYRPHSDSTPNFDVELQKILSHPIIKNKFCLIMGDFNINLANTDSETQNFINNLNAKHFNTTITKPTRFSNHRHSPSILDHIWVNKPTSYVSGIVLNDLTDHCPTFIRLPTKVTSATPEKIKITFRQINNDECRNKFKQELSNYDWNSIKGTDVNNYLNSFIQTLNELFCKCFPLKTKLVTQKSFKNPWVTPRIRKLIQLKSDFFKLYKNNIISKEDNNSLKNKIKQIIDHTKLLYYKQLFVSQKNNISKTWYNIKELLGIKTKGQSSMKIIHNNRDYINHNEIAELFNDYFSGMATTLDNSLPNSTIDPLTYFENNVLSSLYLTPTTAEECASLIAGLKLTKTDKDTVPVILIKNNKNSISKVLSDIINLSFKSGIFPQAFKWGIITPIFKSGNPAHIENYRPITILLILSKIFEKCIYNRIVNFLSEFSILSKQQFGFQKGLSTESAVIALTEFLYDVINSREIALNICIDFRNAFGTVNHNILFRKLENYGLRGPVLSLLKNYLSSRTQSVKIGHHISSPKSISIGLPQGSCLGPLLYILYVNDLPKISPDSFPILYADDTTLCLRSNSIDDAINRANIEIINFYDWATANRLTINTDKTFTMTITNKRLPEIYPLVQLNNLDISAQSSGKFLGVTFDSKLTFKLHITHICTKISKSIGILFKLQQYLSTSSLISLYYTFVYPHFLYCNPVWGSSSDSNLNQLIILQKKCLRIINRKPYNSHTNLLFYSNRILKFPDITKLKIACYMYSHPTTDYNRSHHYDTRYRNNMNPRFQRTNLTQRSLTYSAPTLWNQIPLEIRSSHNIQTFKKQYKSFLIAQYII